jgi:hypothetical protein
MRAFKLGAVKSATETARNITPNVHHGLHI